MLQSMKRIQVIGPKAELNRVVDLLYQAGTVHLENASEEIPMKELSLTPVKLAAAQNIADVLGKIQAIFSTLPVITDDPERQKAARETLATRSYDQIIRRAVEVIRELETTTRDLSARKIELTLAVTALDRYAKVLSIIQPVEKELPTLEGFEVTILLIQKEHAGVIEIIKKEIAEITHNHFEMSTTSVDEDTLATIMVFSKQHSEDVHTFIYSVNVNEVRLPKDTQAGRSSRCSRSSRSRNRETTKRLPPSITASIPSRQSGTRSWSCSRNISRIFMRKWGLMQTSGFPNIPS